MSADGGSDSYNGLSPFGPVATISRALSIAASSRRTIIALGPGTYVESVTLGSAASGSTLTGGYQLDWSPDCSPSARQGTVLEGGGFGLRVNNLSGPEVTVSHLTIRSGSSSMKGGSTYGVFVSAGNVALDDVVVEAAPAEHGASLGPPLPATGTRPCAGVLDCTNGSPGPRGTTGRASDGGWFTPTGWEPGNGSSGINGGVGNNGTPPPLAPSQPSCIGNCTGASPCDNGNLFCGVIGPITVTSGRGSCGCGGLGGVAGAGGTGGGASVALFAVDGSSVRVWNSLLRSGPGGSGGSGADGGAGAPGALGGRGLGTTCHSFIGASSSCGRNACPDNCEAISPVVTIAGGSDGGTGGPGGQGGPGGGGSGGASVGVVSLGSSMLIDGVTVITPGTGGPGADGAQGGFSAPMLLIP